MNMKESLIVYQFEDRMAGSDVEVELDQEDVWLGISPILSRQ